MNNMTVHCLFEQSGIFKNEFKKLGYKAYDYDILNEFGETVEKPDVEEVEDFEDNPYGLAHISTTTLKAELRRRKKSWNRRIEE